MATCPASPARPHLPVPTRAAGYDGYMHMDSWEVARADLVRKLAQEQKYETWTTRLKRWFRKEKETEKNAQENQAKPAKQRR